MVRFKRCLIYIGIYTLVVCIVGNTDPSGTPADPQSQSSQEASVGSDASNVTPEAPTMADSQAGQNEGTKTEEMPPDPPGSKEDVVKDTQSTGSVPSAATKEELESVPTTDEVPVQEGSGQKTAEDTHNQQASCTDCVKVVSQENGDNTAVEGGTTQQIDGGAPEVEKEADTKKDTEKKDTVVEDATKPVGDKEKPVGPPVLPTGTQEPVQPTVQEVPATPSDGKDEQQPEETAKEEVPAKTEKKPTEEKRKLEPEQPDTKTEPVEREEEINLPKQEKDLLSFEEFKKKMMTEMAEKENLQQMEAAQNTPTNGGSGSSMRAPKSRVNYASVTCGAKVLAANSEAQSSSAILTENKDQYMIQPCKARKWFMVELCEPVQVSSLEMGNLELFSSLPKTFVVQLSDRNPVKEWRTLGTFHARDERSIQMFAVSEQQERYSKYMRIEMQSHYGTEHYCPLSLLRVYGTTADDYFDDHNEEIGEEIIPEPEVSKVATIKSQAVAKTATKTITKTVTHKDDPAINQDPTEGERDERDKPTNLFTSAKDTVITLVKNVWSPGDEGEQKAENVTNDIVTMNTTAQNQSSVNATNLVKDEKSDTDMKPCTPVPTTEQESGDDPPLGNLQPEVPEVTTDQPPKTEGGLTGPGYPNAPDPTVLKPQAEKPSRPPLVTLIESGGTLLADVLSRCDFHDPPSMNSHTTCGYYKVMAYVYRGTCQLGRARDTSHQVPGSPTTAETSASSPSVIKDTNTKKCASSKKVDKAKPAGTKPTKNDDKVVKEDISTSIQPTPTQTATDKAPAESEVQPSFTQSPSSKDEKPEATSSMQPKKSVTADAKSSSAASSCEKSTDPSCQMGPDTAHIRPTHSNTETPPVATPTPTTTPKVEEVKQVDQPVTPPPAKSDPEPETPPPEQPAAKVATKELTGDPPVVVPSGANVNIYAEDEEAEMVVSEQITDEVPITKISSSKKQLKFMELNNRLHALELNLNLSSRYLEDLSQRYRRQMEEMYRSLNKTIGKLTNTSRAAAERDVRQQDHIADLQKQIDRLTFTMERIEANVNNVHKEVIERHLYLMCIEAFVIAMVIVWCFSRQQRASRRRLQDYNVSQIPFRDKPPPKTVQHSIQQPQDKKKKKSHIRRNSVDATPPRPPRPPEVLGAQRSLDDLDLCCSGSESSINIVQPGISVFLNDKPNNIDLDCPKRKRKKKHQKQSSYGGSSSAKQSSAESDEPFRNEGSVAGLLFAPYSHHSSSSTDLLKNTNDTRRRSDSFAGLHSSSDIISGGKNKKITARRSLDLATNNSKNKHQGKVKANGMNGKDSKKHPVTNLGATAHMNGHVKDGTMNGSVANGGVHKVPSQSNTNANANHTWKNWFPGIRR